MLVFTIISYNTGRRGSRGKRGVPGSPGTLRLKIWRMDAGYMQELILSYDQKIYSMHLSGAVVDLKAGSILVCCCTEHACSTVVSMLVIRDGGLWFIFRHVCLKPAVEMDA